MTSTDLRRKIADILENNGIASSKAEAVLILMHVLKTDKIHLLTKDIDITDELFDSVMSMVKRRTGGEPIQYIVGETEFMSLRFLVNKNVLIPRPETELLVETVLDRCGSSAAVIADVGCGSGCIGISLAKYLENVFVTEIDISRNALGVAKKNAELNHVSERMSFVQCDILKGFPDFPNPVDAVVSNPPYIKTDVIRDLQTEVREYEPFNALDGGEDGLIFYRKISKSAPLAAGGVLAFEIGFDQGRDVKKIMESCGYTEVEVLRDLENRDRVVIGRKA